MTLFLQSLVAFLYAVHGPRSPSPGRGRGRVGVQNGAVPDMPLISIVTSYKRSRRNTGNEIQGVPKLVCQLCQPINLT